MLDIRALFKEAFQEGLWYLTLEIMSERNELSGCFHVSLLLDEQGNKMVDT